jgi:hypothetical protein
MATSCCAAAEVSFSHRRQVATAPATVSRSRVTTTRQSLASEESTATRAAMQGAPTVNIAVRSAPNIEAVP